MGTREDDALLVLIYQHLKVHGFKKAAKLLEKHLTQVETPEESSNLQDIYTGWVKLCSLAQEAKQETEDSGNLKKESIKPEPVTSEEEEAAKTPNGEEAEDKPLLESKEDAVEPSSPEKEAEMVSNGSPTANPDVQGSECADGGEEEERMQEVSG
ncbi:unnamed protein product [Menidia menidia]|uniref:(Atlantic silverside) hypothetical protein n=1 Tax=Menidia menidia TaxID=238744 RepID=A0A8S4B0T5_9TELE|nr:unnamed protein product [Menidia menidia]CAG5896325.1 unnamed protein product [Menidia menidia]